MRWHPKKESNRNAVIKNTGTKMKNAFEGLICNLNTARKDIKIELSQTEKQKYQEKHTRTQNHIQGLQEKQMDSDNIKEEREKDQKNLKQ